ncbi:MAG TPA: hypothetical protein VIL49_12935, partial [Capillimicrobium sp.]
MRRPGAWRQRGLVCGLALLGALALSPPAAEAAPACRAAVDVAGRGVCVDLRARCRAADASVLLTRDRACRKGRVARASPAQRRRGEPLALSRDGVLSFPAARAAFDARLAALPGVRTRAGSVGRLPDASSVLLVLLADQRRLTPAQRRIVRRVAGLDGAGRPAARAAAADLAGWKAMAAEAQARLQARGLAFVHPVVVRFGAVGVAGADAASLPLWLIGAGDVCQVTITPALRAAPLRYQRVTIAHELTHCAQFESSTVEQAIARPQWVVEGTASWAGNAIGREWSGAPVLNRHYV